MKIGRKHASREASTTVPGILLAWIVAIGAGLFESQVLLRASIALAFINGLNLLPVFPLDGGRLLNDVLFSRNRYIETVFKFLAGSALIIGAIFLREFFIGLMGFITLISIRFSANIGLIAEELKREQDFSSHFSLLESRPEVIDKVITSVLDGLPQENRFNVLANLSSALWNHLSTIPPNLLSSVAIISPYLLSLGVALIFLFL